MVEREVIYSEIKKISMMHEKDEHRRFKDDSINYLNLRWFENFWFFQALDIKKFLNSMIENFSLYSLNLFTICECKKYFFVSFS